MKTLQPPDEWLMAQVAGGNREQLEPLVRRYANRLLTFIERMVGEYQLNARSAVVYLRGLAPGKTLTLRYHLQATMPVKVTAPAARAYEYYNPSNEAYGKPIELKVRPRV